MIDPVALRPRDCSGIVGTATDHTHQSVVPSGQDLIPLRARRRRQYGPGMGSHLDNALIERIDDIHATVADGENRPLRSA
jgi:hypothetical protein